LLEDAARQRSDRSPLDHHIELGHGHGILRGVGGAKKKAVRRTGGKRGSDIAG
jgi:hypothetical protein